MSGIANPLLLDAPPQITTARLILRIPQPGDGPAYHDALRAAHDQLQPWLPQRVYEAMLADSEAYLRRMTASWADRTGLWLGIIRQADGLWLGVINLHHLRWDVPCFELGYWIRPEAEGRGYVSEAVRALTGFAFEALHAERLEIHCDAINTRSAAVATRCGYTLEGRLRCRSRDTAGRLNDDLFFSLLRAEWAALTPPEARQS